MHKLSPQIIRFLEDQGFVIVSTIDEKGRPHSSCKDLIKIDKNGKVYLFDLYFRKTFANLKRNPNISLTAVDEHRFKGYCLKGKAKVITKTEASPLITKAWEKKIAGRITQRVLKNLRGEKGHSRYPESLLPKPQYMIVAEIDEALDLAPQKLKEEV